MQKLSQELDVLTGTEQGHPMSPELFKCYVLGLSQRLNSMCNLNVPSLNKILVSHLLWADDLVLLALDKKSLQQMIDELQSFCMEWGLSVNISKTAVLVFNKSGRQLKESYGFNFGEISIINTFG